MRNVTIFILTILSIGTAYATLKVYPDNWVPIVESKSGYKMYLDRANIQHTESGTIKYWIMTVREQGNHDKSMWEIDCTKNQFILHTLIDFNKQGDIVNAEMNPNPLWYKIMPNSSIESIRKRVCRR
jgi:hypothetical protein